MKFNSNKNKVKNSSNRNKKKTGVKSAKKTKKQCKSKMYSIETLKKAVKEVEEGESLNKTAIKFGIPKSTLSMKVNKKVPLDCKKGPATILSTSEEDALVKWIIESSEKGFPITKARLLENVQKFILKENRKTPFKNGQPGRHWFNAFLRRHPILTKRIAQNLTTTRAAVTESELRQWFSKVKSYLEKKNLINIEPDRVYNLDESEFKLVPKVDKILAEKEASNIYQIVSANEKACVTVLFTASANGKLAPPLILFEMKNTPNRRTLQHIPQGWGVGPTKGGWMTGNSFYNYVKNIFHPWLIINNIKFPVILYVDNHTSHINLQLLEFCKDKEIELIALYPNSTHVIQPLDVAFFHALKNQCKHAVEKYKMTHNVINLKKCMVAPIIKIALDSYNFEQEIINGFKYSGLFPFDADAVNYNVLNEKTTKRKNQNGNKEIEGSTSTVTDLSVDKTKELLRHFERNFIAESTLKMFIEHEFVESWNGDCTQTALFETWREMRRQCVTEREDHNVIYTDICHNQEELSSHYAENVKTLSHVEDNNLQNLSCQELRINLHEVKKVKEVKIINEYGLTEIVPILEVENYLQNEKCADEQILNHTDTNKCILFNDSLKFRM